jgi:hypothetical protein
MVCVKVGIMSSSEIKGLFFTPSGRYLPMGLNILQKLWWRFMPGVVINVAWPRGWVVLHEDPDGSKVSADSADPNDHYRPWMEQHVGRQGWDWNWGMADRDATDNRLTIKIRQRHEKYATIAAIRWS